MTMDLVRASADLVTVVGAAGFVLLLLTVTVQLVAEKLRRRAVDCWSELDALTTRGARDPWATLWGLVVLALVVGLVGKAVTYGDDGPVAFNRDVFLEESARCARLGDASHGERQACWSEARFLASTPRVSRAPLQ